MFKTEKWSPKMDFHMHRSLHPGEADGHGNRVIHVHLSEQPGSKLGFCCESRLAITVFPYQYSIQPFGNKLFTNMVIEPGMSIVDIGTSISGTATHEVTHAFLNSECPPSIALI